MGGPRLHDDEIRSTSPSCGRSSPASSPSTPRWADGRLFAVLDVGGLAVGDPAVDLVCTWEVLDGTSREPFRRAVGADDATWLAGAAWALLIAVSTFPYYWHPMPARCASRRAIAANVIAGL